MFPVGSALYTKMICLFMWSLSNLLWLIWGWYWGKWLASYYRRFVRGFSCIGAALFCLLKINHPLVWSLDCQEAFTGLKQAAATVTRRSPRVRRALLVHCVPCCTWRMWPYRWISLFMPKVQIPKNWKWPFPHIVPFNCSKQDADFTRAIHSEF